MAGAERGADSDSAARRSGCMKALALLVVLSVFFVRLAVIVGIFLLIR